ncbi:hypothetical protein [Polynucleobacter sp. IMCC 29146]|uniref:hypothetical protein n=1 Tax=Polynucleobacter sp. IMCC 29146 TaxID=2780953 RepID=UPI001F196435|nr:hypothetical protein [Polynucleobacter sp. IMCC 29146]MCE7530522.1 hypothetical protein [Polynucleobacter sp. IMCC 29146]
MQNHPANLFSSLSRLVTLVFFIGLLVIGLMLFPDYGVSLDEPAQRLIGIVNLNYLASLFHIQSISEDLHFVNLSTQTLHQIQDRHYGVIFELPAAFLEFIFSLRDERSIYLYRHAFTFLFFFCGALALFFLGKRRFQDWRIGLLGIFILILSPRIFSDAFYNNKDIIFLALYVIATNTLIQFLLKPNLYTAFIHAIATAAAIDVRVIAIFFPILTLSFLGAKYFKKELNIQKLIQLSLVYFLLTIVVTVLFWPFLWINPWDQFLDVWRNLANHPRNPAILFMGNLIPSEKLPWYYVPLWMGLTTPIFYQLLFIIGVSILVWTYLKSRSLWKSNDGLQDFIFICLFFGPLLAIIGSDAPLYNGWRHLYFLYPIFIIIALHGFIFLSNFFKFLHISQWFLFVITFLVFIVTSLWMVHHHPLENLYFNVLAGANWDERFEVDYWGQANRIALEKILEQDNSSNIAIWPGAASKYSSRELTVFTDQLRILKHNEKIRIIEAGKIDQAKYLLVTNRAYLHPNLFLEHGKFQLFDAVSIDGKKILYVFKQNRQETLAPLKTTSLIKFGKKSLGIFYLYSPVEPPLDWDAWNSNNWYTPEDWGAWAKGNAASLTLAHPPKLLMGIKINLRAFIPKENLTQSTALFINDHHMGNILLLKGKNNEFYFPLSKQQMGLGPMKIEFRALKPISPKSQGLSSDSRGLSIGLESIEFI